jgi:hypothetical protein
VVVVTESVVVGVGAVFVMVVTGDGSVVVRFETLAQEQALL